MVEVIVAAIGAVALIGVAYIRRPREPVATENAARLATSNGQTVGEMVEETHHDVKEIRTWLVDHIRDETRHI